MQDLRNHLFETLEALRDKEEPMDLDRAKAICDVAGKLIDSARVEVSYIKVTGAADEGQFFEKPPVRPALPSAEKANGRTI